MVNRSWDKDNKYTEGFLKEYTHWVIEVSYRQHTLGCFIIFAKRTVERISELTTEEIDELKNVMKEAEEAISSAFQPDRFNYLQMGNALHHLHFHGIPRYQTPRTFKNKEWIDTTWGHPPIWSKIDEAHELIKTIQTTLKPHFEK